MIPVKILNETLRSLATSRNFANGVCKFCKYLDCHENFGPENFGPQDQNFQHKYWSIGRFFQKFYIPSENFGPFDLMINSY